MLGLYIPTWIGAKKAPEYAYHCCGCPGNLSQPEEHESIFKAEQIMRWDPSPVTGLHDLDCLLHSFQLANFMDILH